MKIKVPIPVKMIVTDSSKIKMRNEINESIRKLNVELEQLQFQQKKLMNEAQKKGREAVRIVQERMDYETNRRKEKLVTLTEQLNHLEKIEEGEEIFHRFVEAEMEIHVGDSWNQIFHGNEIVIKDGIVIEIRKGALDGNTIY
ncbi:YlqD family protein [Tepidibacillus fermentans]|uniref:YlqD protein n=1 Tax=Tepidibacillus fermentans TaxID=1281767 RepID=A0A4R3K8S5_9BACI|nr:YlqD family protein [Tepidibacillus fermentans]TCS79213.1 YlqD protein [Tepidibacillus fermentans]